MSEELKPCPFCGKGVRMVKYGFYFRVHCKHCNKTIVIENKAPGEGQIDLLTRKRAIAAWNKRNEE